MIIKNNIIAFPVILLCIIFNAQSSFVKSSTLDTDLEDDSSSADKNLPINWDIDGNGSADPLTDGLLLLRRAFELKDASLTNNAISNDSPLSSEEVKARIDEAYEIADIDNNGSVDALTDGLMLLRYLFGLRGNSLIDNAVANDAIRSNAFDIEAFIESKMPHTTPAYSSENELDTNHSQAIVGTQGSDTLRGRDDEYDILIGGEGDDILIGGDNKSPLGGYLIDIYQFGNNSGNDTIKDFFIQEIYEDGSGLTYGKTDGFKRSDRLEIIKGINGTGTDSANDILNSSSNDPDGNALLNLGQGNSIVIEGISLEQIKPEHIHIIEPYFQVIQGTTYKDKLSSISGNSRIEGSNEPYDRYEDSQDVLVSGNGNDVLIGGTNDSSLGGFVIDLYKFSHNSGNDLILGYFDMDFDREGSSINTINSQGSGARSDKILIPNDVNNNSINSFSDLLDFSSNNEDGWAKLNLGDSNFITIHQVPLNQLKPDSFIFTYSDSFTEIYGDSNNNYLYGTSGDDWIQGSDELLGRFGDGIDYIFPRSGNDILSGGSLKIGTSLDTFYTNNYFINDTGSKTIIGFSGTGSELYDPYTKNMLDRLFIEKNGSINYLSELPIVYDDDGFLEISPTEESIIKLHGVKEGHIDASNIILHEKFDTYVFGSKEDDFLNGTSGNDYIDGYGEYVSYSLCAGISTGDDIIDGKEGNDVLLGGISTHFCGGYNRDTFKFSENSGQDVVVDFTSNFENPGLVNKNRHMDVLEIEENINGLSFRTAQELIENSYNNIDGFAVIDLGNSNSITLHDKSTDEIDTKHFRIIPKIDSFIYGTNGDDILDGDDENNYIKGSSDTLDRFEDGHDVLDGGKGDDVLDGGESNSALGGYVTDIYKFDVNYGYDRIFGFFAQDVYENYGGGVGYINYEAGIKSDKIQIPNDVVSYASEIIKNASNNPDGWAQLSFEGTDIIIHMLTKEQLKPHYFHIIPRVSNTIFGTEEMDILIGTDSNDRIMGSANPFDRFGDGADFIEGGKGDDVLAGGPAISPLGGYIKDTYRFNSDFGNDYLISFFAEDLINSSIGYSNPDGEGARQSDRLEFDNIFGLTASELIDNAENNPDGWAKISLGSNSLTIYGISKEDLKPDYFHIIPSISDTIIGTLDADRLIGTEGNDYIVGSNNWLGRFDDGADVIDGGEGDDVLIGGPNRRSLGGYEVDSYLFGENSGNDLIIGFLFDGTGFAGEYNDIIQIPYNANGSGISSFDDILEATANNADGWAVINLGDNNTITLHGVPKARLLERNFNILGVP